jgi:hypothetical protein
LVWGRVLEPHDVHGSAELIREAAQEYERLGVSGLAEQARELVG